VYEFRSVPMTVNGGTISSINDCTLAIFKVEYCIHRLLQGSRGARSSVCFDNRDVSVNGSSGMWGMDTVGSPSAQGGLLGIPTSRMGAASAKDN
jgi:hypothetical protein